MSSNERHFAGRARVEAPCPLRQSDRLRERTLTASALVSASVLLALAWVRPASAGPAEQALAQKYACLSCHSQTQKLVGPSFDAIKAKYTGDPKAVDALVTVLQKGGSGVWGPIPMPGNPGISEPDARTLVTWILATK